MPKPISKPGQAWTGCGLLLRSPPKIGQTSLLPARSSDCVALKLGSFVPKGPEPKDFLGNEFLLWLWHASEGRHGVVQSEVGETSVMIDRFIDLDCAYGATGKDSLRGTGPHQMPEARDALRSGKLPRKAGLVIECNGMQFTLGLNPESFLIGSAKLPDVEEAANGVFALGHGVESKPVEGLLRRFAEKWRSTEGVGNGLGQ